MCVGWTGPAVVFGDPHFITFDGVSYSFNGQGEYTLVVSEAQRLEVQGRTTPVTLPNGELPTALRASLLPRLPSRQTTPAPPRPSL